MARYGSVPLDFLGGVDEAPVLRPEGGVVVRVFVRVFCVNEEPTAGMGILLQKRVDHALPPLRIAQGDHPPIFIMVVVKEPQVVVHLCRRSQVTPDREGERKASGGPLA